MKRIRNDGLRAKRSSLARALGRDSGRMREDRTMAFAVSQKKSRSGGLSQVIADVIGSNDVLSAVSAQGLSVLQGSQQR